MRHANLDRNHLTSTILDLLATLCSTLLARPISGFLQRERRSRPVFWVEPGLHRHGWPPLLFASFIALIARKLHIRLWAEELGHDSLALLTFCPLCRFPIRGIEFTLHRTMGDIIESKLSSVVDQ